MPSRFASIWFRHLYTDWLSLRHPEWKDQPFVLWDTFKGRKVITATNAWAEKKDIHAGMALADARAAIPDLVALESKEDITIKLLTRLAEWCIRFSPVVAIDPPDGLLMEVTGCAHLWGGEEPYLDDILAKLHHHGYTVRAALADTPGLAWGVARFGRAPFVIESEKHLEALLSLPPEALRLEPETLERLRKLGFHQIKQFISLPRSPLRRRFGAGFILQLDKILGHSLEWIEPVLPAQPYQERLPCLEPIVTATGISIALQQLLETLCMRLRLEQKGLRKAVFKGYRSDGKVECIEIGTSRPSHHIHHLFKLFELKLSTIEPALGIELFLLEAPKVEDHPAQQERMWGGSGGLEDVRVSELIDRLSCRIGPDAIHRYLPDEHYWPERSYKPAVSFQEKPLTGWRGDKPRPLQLLFTPQRIEVTAPIPDYPPMLFRHQGRLHKIVKADGPERIEQEWWIQRGQHRDYYRVEDEEGGRYWLFRLGHYEEEKFHWYLHGYFA